MTLPPNDLRPTACIRTAGQSVSSLVWMISRLNARRVVPGAATRTYHKQPQSRYLRFALSPYLRFALSPYLRFALSPYLRFALSPISVCCVSPCLRAPHPPFAFRPHGSGRAPCPSFGARRIASVTKRLAVLTESSRLRPLPRQAAIAADSVQPDP